MQSVNPFPPEPLSSWRQAHNSALNRPTTRLQLQYRLVQACTQRGHMGPHAASHTGWASVTTSPRDQGRRGLRPFQGSPVVLGVSKGLVEGWLGSWNLRAHRDTKSLPCKQALSHNRPFWKGGEKGRPWLGSQFLHIEFI